MSPCPACEAARTRKHAGGIQMRGCRGCQVRRIANAPPHVRDDTFWSIGDSVKRSRFEADVLAEQQRSKGMST